MIAKAGRMRREHPEEGPAGARSSGLKLEQCKDFLKPCFAQEDRHNRMRMKKTC